MSDLILKVGLRGLQTICYVVAVLFAYFALFILFGGEHGFVKNLFIAILCSAGCFLSLIVGSQICEE